jgi:hypothetical protein
VRNAWAIVLALLLAASSVLAAPAAITDRTFADGDWSLVTFVTGDGGLVEGLQTSVGNPAPSRRIRNVVNAAPSPTEFSAIYGVHLYAGQTYDPSTQGPLTNVDYFEDALLVQGFGDGQAAGIALRQAGSVYIRQVGSTPDFAWAPKQDLGVPASAFVRIFDGGFDSGSHPDFSAAGGPIEFGFFRANSTSLGAIGYEVVALIDNWTVLVNTPCAIDEECVYPDGCFVGACVAGTGTCKATVMACDDGDSCTTDFCADGACDTTPVVCDDGDACTTDSCGAGGCSTAPLDCDDGLPCTVDACSAGTCMHGLDFVTIQNAIDGLLMLLDSPPCAGEGVTPPTRKKFVKKLTKAHARLGLADAATKAKLVTRFVGKAEHLLEVATTRLGKASDAGKISPACATSVGSYLASLLTCTDTLPLP